MSKIPNYIIRNILDRAAIADVVGDFLPLKKTGVRYTTLCPFHKERHVGTFIVYPKGNCYKCFACGAKGGVVDFLMNYVKLSYPDAIRWLGKKYCIETDNIPMNYTPPPVPPSPPSLPVLSLPWHMVQRREEGTEKNTLVKWLRTISWSSPQRARLEANLADYHIGHSWKGHTIFWQIDDHGQVRTGKMMRYRADGHRDKESRYNFDWIHSALFRDRTHPEYSEEAYDIHPCLFGLHLLNKYPYAAVNIVESEKTALIMATAYGNHYQQIWMACGGLENLNREKLAPLIGQHRKIILYPDRDAIDKWRAKQENLHYDRACINVEIVKDWWLPEDGAKADCADVLLRLINSKEK